MLLRVLRTYLAPYKSLLGCIVVLQFLSVGAMLYLPTLNADIIDNGVAKGDQGIREVMADYVGLKPHVDVAIHHVTRAGDYALVRSQWRITGTGRDCVSG